MDRERALALYDEGRAAMARSDLYTASVKLRESVAILPTAPSVAALGESLLGLSRYGEAVVHLAAALQMGANAPSVRTALATALGKIGERDKALEQLRIAIREEPGNAGARAELQRLLSDPEVMARTANRHRILHELRIAVPEIRFEESAPAVAVLRSIGTYVAMAIELGRQPEQLATVFHFLNRLAVSPDQEVSDLLAATVFPVLAERRDTIEVAQRLLVGRARAGFEDAIALWGVPAWREPSPLARGLRAALRFFVPGLETKPHWEIEKTARAFGHHLVHRVTAGASDDQLADAFRLLSRLHRSSAEGNEVFEIALAVLFESRELRVRETALRLLTDSAREAFEQLM
jgi:tetratricopeptide (TPR) repeat protein